ncbi:MAG TPA: chemotaxis protein CheA [Pseudobacteroides sp.]|uniref:chemotaxis protein CheA n=1 Tax=Pseudobacteroides sp. TaxID=1968840 RepID=UPI002F93C121
MSDNYREPMLEMYKFETNQLIEQLEQLIISSEKSSCYSQEAINEIFRIMHTIKGSSAMMLFNGISTLAHSIEDLFFFLRESKPAKVDYIKLSDLILCCTDFIKEELSKIERGIEPDGDSGDLVNNIKTYLGDLKGVGGISASEKAASSEEKTADNKKQKYYITYSLNGDTVKTCFRAALYFDDGCEMENIRAFSVLHSLKDVAQDIMSEPSDIIENEESAQVIRENGFKMFFNSNSSFEDIEKILKETIFLKKLELEVVEKGEAAPAIKKKPIIDLESPKPVMPESAKPEREKEQAGKSTQQNIISVNVSKLDKLMDLVGELVISEAMVTSNPDLRGLSLDNFSKAANQLKKITSELQDIVMSIRMVPLSGTFHKMNRIVRDMCKKLNKDVELEILGEETEVDKNIIENISDPLMHLIRNSIDHGIETKEERKQKGKSAKGKITLEAKNEGGEVIIIVKDDGRGLNKDKILRKAIDNGLIQDTGKDISEREIFSMIFLPGFSTKENVTEFSGRGVGMDVVSNNIEKIGGIVNVDSTVDEGTTMTIRIPLTLAIIDGMNIRVANSTYTIPITSIKESFRIKENELITDPDGNEMIMVRGDCYPVIRIHRLFNINDSITNIHEGITIMVESEMNTVCLFADELLGEQQVVVKALPQYIKKVRGIAGCTLLGEGTISLILDIAAIVKNK